jgi:hypothetical protein
MTVNIQNCHKILRQFSFQILPKLEFLVWKQTIWQPWWSGLRIFWPEAEEEAERDGQGEQGEDVSDEVDGDGEVLGGLGDGRNLDGAAVVVVRAQVPLAGVGAAACRVACKGRRTSYGRWILGNEFREIFWSMNFGRNFFGPRIWSINLGEKSWMKKWL